MKHLDLFSGIGGFALAAEIVWPDVEHVFCDNDPFAQAILKKHWPNSIIHNDIKTLVPPPADIVTGGFPCQPFSTAGLRRGTEDDRHLWPEMFRVIRASSPRWVIAENVGGLVTWDRGMVLESIIADLEGAGYEVWPIIIPACAVDAPHKRDRIWIIAHAIGSDAGRAPGPDARASAAQGLRQRDSVEQPSEPNSLRIPSDTGYPSGRTHAAQGGVKRKLSVQPGRGEATNISRNENFITPDSSSTRRFEGHPLSEGTRSRESKTQERHRLADSDSLWAEDWPTVATRLCPVDDGLRPNVARPRGWRNAALKGAGNAIVPQVAAEIMRAISTVDR